MMKKFAKILILSIFTILMIGGFAKSAFAVDPLPLSVTFSSNPLFSEANFAPGNEVISTVGVGNYSGGSKNIITEATNAIDTGGLGDKLNLVIKEGNTIRYTGTLGQFLRAGEVSLSSLANTSDTTYTFGITFDNTANNDVQNKTLGFDLCVGFQGGQTHCGTTVISDENGGGGNSGGSMPLIISDEQALSITNVDASGSVTITWNTNKLATSQVIYGLAPGPYNLKILILPNLGYPLGSAEDGNKVMNHSMFLTGLTPGATYLYRVVSRASPATVSYEHQFTVPLLAQAGNPNPGLVLGASAGGNGGPVSGSASNGTSGSVLGETTSATEETSDLDENLAAVFASGFRDIFSVCTLIGLLILLAIYLIWKLWLRGKYEKDLIAEEEIRNRFWLFFGGSSLLAILVCVILNEYCPLPVFVIAFIISLCLYAYRKFKI